MSLTPPCRANGITWTRIPARTTSLNAMSITLQTGVPITPTRSACHFTRNYDEQQRSRFEQGQQPGAVRDFNGLDRVDLRDRARSPRSKYRHRQDGTAAGDADADIRPRRRG